MITKKMTNIEQKVFATQKNMDSIANAPTSEVGTKSPQPDKKSGDKETLKMMLEALQKQQEQINQFMLST